jgi:hypothetical protein
MHSKHQAGYYSANVNKDALNYMRRILTEKPDDASEENPQEKSDILK